MLRNHFILGVAHSHLGAAVYMILLLNTCPFKGLILSLASWGKKFCIQKFYYLSITSYSESQNCRNQGSYFLLIDGRIRIREAQNTCHWITNLNTEPIRIWIQIRNTGNQLNASIVDRIQLGLELFGGLAYAGSRSQFCSKYKEKCSKLSVTFKTATKTHSAYTMYGAVVFFVELLL